MATKTKNNYFAHPYLDRASWAKYDEFPDEREEDICTMTAGDFHRHIEQWNPWAALAATVLWKAHKDLKSKSSALRQEAREFILSDECRLYDYTDGEVIERLREIARRIV